MLAALIQTRAIPWNLQTGHQAICRGADGGFPVLPQVGGLQLTVLGPDRPTLRRLRDNWMKACREANLEFGSVEDALDVLGKRSNLQPTKGYLGAPGVPNIPALAAKVFAKDLSLANRSSIVLLAEYGDVRVLLAGDATPNALLPAVREFLAARAVSQLPLTALKLPHHGSARNVTKELVNLLPADYYLFSSDGTQFSHPDDSAVAVVAEYGKPGAELVFNYRNSRTNQWSDRRLAQNGYRFRVRYPEAEGRGVRVTLSAAVPTVEVAGAADDKLSGADPSSAQIGALTQPEVSPSGGARTRPAREVGSRSTPARARTAETVTVTVGSDGSVRAESSDGTGVANGHLHEDRLEEKLIRHFERWLALRERTWDEDEVRAFGMLLYRRLFADSTDVWHYIQRRLDARGWSPLRIQLAFPDATEFASLAALPWEYLHTPESTGRSGYFLAAQPSLVLARYVPSSFEAPRLKPQESLRLLPVVADPDPFGLGEVDYAPALAVIDALDPASGIEPLPPLLDASPSGLGREIDRSRPQIVHFIGHGRFDPELGRGNLALTEVSGGAKWVTESQLVSRLCRPGHVPHLVVLHTCEGGRPEFEDRFAGLGPALVRAGVGYVAGMQYAVPNDVATIFTERLYELLSQREPLDRAVQECRFTLADVSDDPRLLGFPVLYQSGTDPILTTPQGAK